MKAIKCTKYGAPEVLKIVDIDKPQPKDDEILIKIYASTVTVADCRVRGFNVPPSFYIPAMLVLGIGKPKKPILGGELSGVIEETGKNVTKFKTGDAVFAFPGKNFGAYAEYICLNVNKCIALKPESLSFEESAALSFGGITAMYFLKKSNIQNGDKVLIYGASGCIGSSAVQLAKYLGAAVTGICSTGNLEMVKKIGADTVIDYTQTDLADINERYDVVFDTVGKADISKMVNLIKPSGHYLHAVTDPFTIRKIRQKLKGTNIQLTGGSYTANIDQINEIAQLAAAGAIKPLIDRHYNFDEIVPAHEYVDKGHKKGSVVIKVSG